MVKLQARPGKTLLTPTIFSPSDDLPLTSNSSLEISLILLSEVYSHSILLSYFNSSFALFSTPPKC
jgi:hypothetical protein